MPRFKENLPRSRLQDPLSEVDCNAEIFQGKVAMELLIGIYLAAVVLGIGAGILLAHLFAVIPLVVITVALVFLFLELRKPPPQGSGSGAVGAVLIFGLPLLIFSLACIVSTWGTWLYLHGDTTQGLWQGISPYIFR